MIRFVFSRKFILSCFLLSLALSVSYAVYGSECINGVFKSIWKWFSGGDYSGYAVLSTAFAMNTWGVAVRSIRRRIQLQCRRHIEDVVIRLSSSTIVADGNRRVLEFVWQQRNNAKVRRRVNKLISRIEYYKKMAPHIFTISTGLVQVAMVLCATISVICLIFEINGRFCAFLLLPYPLFWMYSWAANAWIWLILHWNLWQVLSITPELAESDEIAKFMGNIKTMNMMLQKSLNSKGRAVAPL